MNIGFLLGAGFSVNAGLPTAREINERLNYRPLVEKVLYYGSGEWGWYDLASPPNQWNGKINYYERIPITYILDEIQGFLIKIDKDQ